MKKIIVLFLVLYCTLLNAQEFKFGAKAGLNLSSLRYDPQPPFNFKLKPGFHIGGVVQYKLNEKFSLEAQLLFSQQGSKHEIFVDHPIPSPNNPSDPFIGPGNIKIEAKTQLNYINLPVLARYYFNESISVSFGPQIAYLLNAKGEENSREYNIKEEFSDIDFGLNAGLGYEFTNGIFLNANYYYGMHNIDNLDSFAEQEIKQNVIQFSVGYLF